MEEPLGAVTRNVLFAFFFTIFMLECVWAAVASNVETNGRIATVRHIIIGGELERVR